MGKAAEIISMYITCKVTPYMMSKVFIIKEVLIGYGIYDQPCDL